MIKDSGKRRKFASGAERDIDDNKGRCDLLPLDIVGDSLCDPILLVISQYVYTGESNYIYGVIEIFSVKRWGDKETAMLEVAKHYEEGCNKYGARNWEKGIDLHCYIDSGVRHYLKYLRGDKDEPHDRAFIWNMLGALWTQKHKPELIDLPFGEAVKE